MLTPRSTVLIADDHPPTRVGIRASLQAGGFEVCAEVGSGTAAFEAALATVPDVCLLDVHMPGGGIQAAAAISERLPQTSVVMLTVSPLEEDLLAAIYAGAVGYLLKDIDPDRLAPTLRAVLGGEAALPRHLAARILEELRDRHTRRRVAVESGRSVNLTSREWEVLEAIRHGLSTVQTADRLGIAPVTVRTHVRAILRKLRLPDRDAVRRLFDEPQA